MRKFGSPRTAQLHGHAAYPEETTLAKYGPAFREFCAAMRAGDGFWRDKITQDELEALIKHKRVKSGATLAEINDANGEGKRSSFLLSHDAINRGILVDARCARLGVPYQCPTCIGHGYVYTAPTAHVSLVLWWLHPRKGCSRGIEITRIEQCDLPAIRTFLLDAAKRNAERFAGLEQLPETV